MIKVKVEKFEGPLDLLLKLIEDEEMDITKISLAYIADSYIEHIEKSENINPGDISDFLVVASRLLLIKSRALLPYLYPEEEEEIDEFTKQLKMYKEFLDASEKIEKIISEGNVMFAKEFNKAALIPDARFSPPEKLTKDEMKSVFVNLLKTLRPLDKFKERTIEPVMSLEEKIISIKKEVLESVRISFTRLIKNTKNKTEIVVSFLAMLELEKQREVYVEQEEVFGEIIINRC